MMKVEGRNRHLRTSHALAGVAALFVAIASVSQAAEVHLRRDCRCTGALVTLGDVAEIYSNNPREKAQLAAVELFPAPSAGSSRLVRLREVQDVLTQRGVDLRQCRLSGASSVNVVASAPQTTVRATPKRNVQGEAESNIVEYLNRVAGFAQWQVRLNITGDLQRAMSGGEQIVRINGGRDPWVGSQRFTIVVSDGTATRDLPIVANVQRAMVVVVPVRALSRGQIIQASDVQLQTIESSANYPNALASIQQAIGQETTRALPANRPMQRGDTRAPLLVTKGSVVTVFARSPGIQVRTSAKALEDGARDDVIKLQRLDDRHEHYVARVVGHKEVEILAGSPRVESPAAQRPLSNTPRADTNRLGKTEQPSIFSLRVLPSN